PAAPPPIPPWPGVFTREAHRMIGEELKREKLVDRRRMKRFRPDQYRMDATLNKGPNTLLVKVTQSRLHWRFAVRITDGDGQTIPDLIFRAHSEY
ncbi:MAG: hypothetical protein O6952_09330, partial [Planctomycetota bacterium]|nr:hypothetical protein [Planctomycetota bacterium]